MAREDTRELLVYTKAWSPCQSWGGGGGVQSFYPDIDQQREKAVTTRNIEQASW